MTRFRFRSVLWLLAVSGCSSLELDLSTASRVVARFDPDGGAIPMPNDIVRNDATGRLDLPVDDPSYSAAEIAFRRYLNGRDAWSTAFPGRVEFSGPIDPASITADTLQVWEWGETPTRIPWQWRDQQGDPGFEGPQAEMNDERTQLTVFAPRHGWKPGGKVVMLIRGGVRLTKDETSVVKDPEGFAIGTDGPFYFLKLKERVDTLAHNRAFPGDSLEDRLLTAADLEEARQKLASTFDFLEGDRLPPEARIRREQIASLWSFTVTRTPELAMDRVSQRVPVPFDLLIDPAAGRPDLAETSWDSALEKGAKVQANALNGFGLTPHLMFEFSSAVDPASLQAGRIKLFELGTPLTEIPLERIALMTWDRAEPCAGASIDPGCKYLSLWISPARLPLKQKTSYAVVVRRGVRGVDGEEVVPMATGHLLKSESPVLVDGKSQVSSIKDDLALRLELSRARLSPLLDALDRSEILAAWSFTTQDPRARVEQAVHAAAALQIPPEPEILTVRTLDDQNRTSILESLFPGELGAIARAAYALRVRGVGKVVEGTIRSPYLLDRRTRALRKDGGFAEEKLNFILTLPENPIPGKPIPVVMFAHAVVTDKRFMLTIAGPLAQKGFAAVGIDFPYHGDRIACINASLIAVPNFLPPELRALTGLKDDLLSLPPCASGERARCSEVGECLGPDGKPEPFNTMLRIQGKPALLDLRPASGAAFLDMHDVPHINDHMLQALTDLGALKRSLSEGGWSARIGQSLKTDKLYFVGQSLGAIIGSTFTAVAGGFERIVLNVPGSDLVDLFVESEFFGYGVRDYFHQEKLVAGGFERERFLNIARWLIDSVDPHTFAPLHRERKTAGLIQMDTGKPNGDMVIPNRTSWELVRLSGYPVKEYSSILHADLIIPMLGDAMLSDLVHFLAGGKVP